MQITLELMSSFITFAGGAILSLDALLVRKKIRMEANAHRLQEFFEKAGAGDLLKNAEGKPLKDDQTLKLWLSERPLRWTKVGFFLMALGFLLDFITKLCKA